MFTPHGGDAPPLLAFYSRNVALSPSICDSMVSTEHLLVRQRVTHWGCSQTALQTLNPSFFHTVQEPCLSTALLDAPVSPGAVAIIKTDRGTRTIIPID